MTFLAFAAALVIGQQPAPAPDRSGESELRRILTWAKNLNNAHVVIFTSARDTAQSLMYPGFRIDLWMSGDKFRLETATMWDAGTMVVCDGTTVLSDSKSEYEPAVVDAAKGSVLATLAEVKVEADDLSAFFMLMKGPDGLDKLVDKTSSVVATGKGDSEVLTFSGKKLGGVRLVYHEEGKQPVVDRIEYDNKAYLEEQAKKYPEWVDPPDPGTLTRNDIVFATDRPSASLFDARPAKGRTFEDKRAKKGKAS
jgi:hypothetical protein